MTKYSDPRMRTSAAGVHRSALRKAGIDVEWWYLKFELQDGLCDCCEFETIYLIPFPPKRPPYKCLICKTCMSAWEDRDVLIPQLEARLEWLRIEDRAPIPPTEAQVYLMARREGKIVIPFGQNLTDEQYDLWLENKLHINTWEGAPEEHRPVRPVPQVAE